MAGYDSDIVYPNRLDDQNFRLLELLPGEANDALQCQLVETPLTDIPVYEALSYVWGDSTVTELLCCNGQNLPITTNLAQALRKLRFPTTTRLLWADAVCINQQDIQERNHQVQLMKEIYSKSTGVVVWLGEDPDGHGKNAISAMTIVVKYLEAYQEALRFMREKKTAPSWLKGRGHFTFETCEHALRSSGIDDPWTSLSAFYQLPWFSRIWCVQEVYLAQGVMLLFGSQAVGGKLVAEFLAWFTREYVFESAKIVGSKIPVAFRGSAIRHADNTFNHRNLYARDLSFVCEDFRALQATDARDKVYGILGLWRPGENYVPLEVDYAKPVSQVYTDVVLHDISSREDLFTLRFVDHDVDYEFDPNDSFPSWVPRWDRGEPWQFGWLDKSPLTATQFKAEVPDRELAHSGILSVKGVLFDRIAWTTDILEHGALSLYRNQSVQNRFVKLYKEATGELNSEFSHHVSFIELASTMTWGLIKIGDDSLDKDFDAPDAWLDISDIDTDTGSAFLENFLRFMDSDNPDGNGDEYKRLMRCKDHRLFRTVRGHLGIGRRNLREGDCVTVLHGGRVPHILRLHSHGHFTYVGDSFVHDIMQRQVYDMFDVDGVMPGVFEIH